MSQFFFAEGQRLPLASIVVIEIKRPMRNDAAAGEAKDPIEQALGYLERIRDGAHKWQPGVRYLGRKKSPASAMVCAILRRASNSDAGSCNYP